ncbi:RodZ domain-containing protein [Cupriavidus oxalaticus]|uniref:Helix-turn-helix domain-containing protein n=1 Tax=Cupriavidus oxalaticus TaxID=96344 RepID=A0A5P3VM88_9BURK|nr:RodZ domain-containing protein [Cupriavidus oxalaticus]QEZ47065.1 helix-turn-helix domain-containing protein [Cupriavidus oxalaticus]
MSEHDRAAGQAVPTQFVGGGAHEGDREAAAREIGAALAREREAQRLSVEDVSARLKVAAPKLRAIEAGDLQALPDVTFAKGVMRAYARMLHVDIDALLARFQPPVAPVTEIARQREGSLNAAFDDRNRFRTGGGGGRWIWLALVAVVLAAGGWFGLDHIRQWIETRSSAAETATTEEHAAAQSTEPGTVTAALPPVMAAADSPAPSAETTPATAVVATAAPASAAAVVPVVAPVAATAAPVPAAPAAPAGEGDLQIRFAGDTWYEIRDSSGKVVLGGTARAGQAVAGGGKAPYRVVIGNVKGVESMTRNGAPVDLKAANRNNVARLTLP